MLKLDIADEKIRAVVEMSSGEGLIDLLISFRDEHNKLIDAVNALEGRVFGSNFVPEPAQADPVEELFAYLIGVPKDIKVVHRLNAARAYYEKMKAGKAEWPENIKEQDDE